MGRGEHVPTATTAAIHRCGAQEQVPLLIDDLGANRVFIVCLPRFGELRRPRLATPQASDRILNAGT